MHVLIYVDSMHIKYVFPVGMYTRVVILIYELDYHIIAYMHNTSSYAYICHASNTYDVVIMTHAAHTYSGSFTKISISMHTSYSTTQVQYSSSSTRVRGV